MKKTLNALLIIFLFVPSAWSQLFQDYDANDIAGTDGSVKALTTLVARPAPPSKCLNLQKHSSITSPKVEEGLLLVGSDLFNKTMHSAPINAAYWTVFLNAKSSEPFKDNITASASFSINYQDGENLYLVYYHNYPPTNMVASVIHSYNTVPGAKVVESSIPTSRLVGCYDVRTSNSTYKFYWLSLHKTKIHKDALFLLSTENHPDPTQNDPSSPYSKKNKLHGAMIRQGKYDDEWRGIINQFIFK